MTRLNSHPSPFHNVLVWQQESAKSAKVQKNLKITSAFQAFHPHNLVYCIKQPNVLDNMHLVYKKLKITSAF
jgi:hypothetical protein